MDATSWVVYWGLLLFPFVQEDAAVVSAASVALMGNHSAVLAYCAVLAGLTLSDVWKYWAGRLARKHRWAQAFAAKPGVMAARDKVLNRLGVAMLTARFVPGTRIPLYVASGFFKAPFLPFFAYMFGSAVLYVSIVFGLFIGLGAVAGEGVKHLLPFAAVFVVLSVLSASLLRERAARRRLARVQSEAALGPQPLTDEGAGGAH